jgi:hypothetical protein
MGRFAVYDAGPVSEGNRIEAEACMILSSSRKSLLAQAGLPIYEFGSI